MLVRPNHGLVNTAWRWMCDTLWHLPSGVSKRTWAAFAKSQHTAVRSLMCQMMLFEARGDCTTARAEHLIRKVLKPRAVGEALDALVAEGLLTRQDGNVVTEALLAKTSAAGEWVGIIP